MARSRSRERLLDRRRPQASSNEQHEDDVSRRVVLVGATLAAFAWVASDDTASVFFDLGPLSGTDILLAGGLGVAWATSLRWIWRAHIMEQVFGFDERTLPATSS